MSSPTNDHHHRMLNRHQHQVTKTDSSKLETCRKMICTMTFFTVVQLAQIRCSESTSNPIGQQMGQEFTHSLYDADPIVFNTNSLYKSHGRLKRSPTKNQRFVDACQSKMEVLTPYYATNSKGKLRTIVNSELMQQAIQVETCVR